MFRLLSSSNYLSYRSIVFEANVESSNVSVDIRQEYGIFFLQANNSEPPDYSWSAALYKNCIARFFQNLSTFSRCPSCVYMLGI